MLASVKGEVNQYIKQYKKYEIKEKVNLYFKEKRHHGIKNKK